MDTEPPLNEEGRRLSGVLALCHAAEVAAAEPLKIRAGACWFRRGDD